MEMNRNVIVSPLQTLLMALRMQDVHNLYVKSETNEDMVCQLKFFKHLNMKVKWLIEYQSSS